MTAPVTAAPAARATPVIDAQDICVRYGHHHVLDHVAFRVQPAEFVGIVGPNGGGKSTLLRAILGLAPTTCGEVRLFGTPVAAFHERERIAYVPQNVVHVDPRFPVTAEEVVLMGRIARRGLLRRFSSADRERARAALEEVGIARLAARAIGHLSGGERQRVFLAKALASEPEVLLLDEPTTGVDAAAREEFYRLLDRLNHDKRMTIILVSHDTQAISLTAHRLVAVNRTIVFDGPPREFEASGGYGAAYDIHLDHGEVTP